MGTKKHPDRLLSNDGEFFGYHSTIRKDYPCHWHNFYEFEYIRDGEYIHIVNGKRRILGKGDLVFCTSSDVHAIEVPDVAYLSTIHFTENHLTETSRRIINSLKSRDFSFDDETFGVVRDMIFQLHSLQKNEYPNNLDFIKNRIEAVLLYCAAFDGQTETEAKNNNLMDAVWYIDRNFREPVTLEKAANLAGLSKGAFSASFHKQMGVTFQEYLINKRIKWASTLLKTTEFNVTQIAFDSGFRSHSHFSHSFKANKGVSPTVYRKKHLKNAENEQIH